MRGLLRTAATVYVIIKVAPAVIKGVVYITEGAIEGITNKIVKDVLNVMDDNRKNRRRSLRRCDRTYTSYTGCHNRSKEKA